MPNLSSLAPITTAATALSNLILATPQSVQGYQPLNKPDATGQPSERQQPPPLLFHYEGENQVELSSDITDHYVEDNTAIQDQIALKPEIISTEGFIGELNDVVPKALLPLKFIADKLTALTAYSPQLTSTAQLAYAQAFFIYQTANNAIDAAVSAWSSISGGVNGGQAVIGAGGLVPPSGAQNKQQTMFQQFYGYWRSRTLFTVQTPWAVFQNMAIQNVIPVQAAETKQITTFKVTFKMIRNATTISTKPIGATFQGRAKAQASGLVDLGTSSPVSSIPLSSGLSTMGVA
jgi:hypothetical protein